MQTQGAALFSGLAAVTKSDTTLINCRALWIGGTGDVAISTSATAAAVTISAVPAGVLLPIGLDQGRVMSTNTTATLIVALQ